MIYFDNSATTKPCETAISEMISSAASEWGNPSSLHELGIEAEATLEKARKLFSESIFCRSDEIFFTAGGTQGNNIAILGAAIAGRKKGKTVITTKIEHPSVLRCFEYLKENDFNVRYLSVDKYGKIRLDELGSMLNDDVVLVSIMTVNNELGTIQPISEVGKLIHKNAKNAVFHSDMVQAFGKMNINVGKLGVDLATFSGHKIHAPKGAGALFVKKGTKLVSPSLGGGQEGGIRSGTQPMPAIAGFYGAMKETDIKKGEKVVGEINRYLKNEFSMIENITVNSPDDALAYILNISVTGYPSEVLLNYLSDREIYVSSGSACAKGQKSEVLIAAGLPSSNINSSLRLSFSRYNTVEEARRFVAALKNAMTDIRSR